MYYHCRCSNSKSISVLVAAGRKFSRVADELVLRYGASNSFEKASHYLRKDFRIRLSSETLRSRILVVSGQIRQYRNSGDDTYEWDGLPDQKLYGYADDVLIHLRREGWKECKLLRYEDEPGSGPIESSCKTVVQGHLKGPGMRWSRQGTTAMLEVRCALYSDIWENAIKNCA
jgi:hypothetical protein